MALPVCIDFTIQDKEEFNVLFVLNKEGNPLNLQTFPSDVKFELLTKEGSLVGEYFRADNEVIVSGDTNEELTIALPPSAFADYNEFKYKIWFIFEEEAEKLYITGNIKTSTIEFEGNTTQEFVVDLTSL